MVMLYMDGLRWEVPDEEYKHITQSSGPPVAFTPHPGQAAWDVGFDDDSDFETEDEFWLEDEHVDGEQP